MTFFLTKHDVCGFVPTDEGRRIENPVIAQTLHVLDQCTGGIAPADLDVTRATLAKVLSRVREEGP